MDRKHKKIFLIFFILLTISLVGFYLPNLAKAADDDLIITEIMYNSEEGGADHDWVELYNQGANNITIKKGNYADSWRFTDDMESDETTTEKHTFPENITIRPKEFIILSPNPTTFLADYPALSEMADRVKKVSLSLPEKKGATLALSGSKGLSWFSKFSYNPSLGADGNGKTLERKNINLPDNDSDWRESYACHGTPLEKSSEKSSLPNGVTINELLPHPSASEKEFVELFNNGNSPISLDCWSLEDKSKSKYPLSGNILDKKDFLVLDDLSFRLNDDGEELYLINPAGDATKVSYDDYAKEAYAYAFDGGKFSWTSTPTPGAENVITAFEGIKPAEENLSSAKKIHLNEILPNPKGDERLGEFIEIINREKEPVDLYGFMIRDASKTGKYIFKEHKILKPDQYLAIYRPQFKIALNNSRESVSLYNPQGKMISSVSYDKSSENASYNFDGKNWKWSKFLTPGEKNKFDQPPKVKIKKTKRAYKNLYAQFSVKAKDKETKHLKYTWDFGDGHKSYLKNTSHKYLKTGKYHVTLTVRDASQAVEKVFPLTVQKYPRPKIEITKAVPNPKGLDSLGETVSLKNNSKTKVSLLNYKIATGSKKLVNHPIAGDIILKPGEEKIITRVDSKITLNNKAGKIALLYPDGKAADEISYAKDKISDDEAYAKVGGNWQWIAANNTEEDKNGKEKNILADNLNNKTINQPVILGATDENIFAFSPTYTNFSLEDAYIFLSQINFAIPTAGETNHCPLVQPASLFAYLLASAF